MKFKAQSKDLKVKLDNLHKIARTKTTIPIFDYFKIETKDDVVLITAADKDVTLVAKIVPDEVVRTGAVCVIADKFADIVKNFKDTLLDFSVEDKRVGDVRRINMVIKSKSGSFKIPCVDAEDFPWIHNPESDAVMSLPTIDVISAINKTMFAVENDELRPTLGGIYFDFQVDKTAFVATNRSKLGVYYSEAVVSYPSSLICPAKMAATLLGTINEEDISMNLSFDDKTIKIELSQYDIYCRQIEGEYVNYAPHLTQSVEVGVRVRTQDLSESLKRSMICANERSAVVAISTLIGFISVSSEDVDWQLEATEELEAENIEGSGIIKINGRFLSEILQRVSTDFVEIRFSSTHPVIYITPVNTSENYSFMLAQLAK